MHTFSTVLGSDAMTVQGSEILAQRFMGEVSCVAKQLHCTLSIHHQATHLLKLAARAMQKVLHGDDAAISGG